MHEVLSLADPGEDARGLDAASQESLVVGDAHVNAVVSIGLQAECCFLFESDDLGFAHVEGGSFDVFASFDEPRRDGQISDSDAFLDPSTLRLWLPRSSQVFPSCCSVT